MEHEYAHILRAIADDIHTPVERSAKGKNKWVWIGIQSALYTLVVNLDSYDLRLAPKTIRIGDMDVREPMRVAPEIGTRYWIVSLACNDRVSYSEWTNACYDTQNLSRGICHLKEADCRTHAEALIKVSRGAL